MPAEAKLEAFRVALGERVGQTATPESTVIGGVRDSAVRSGAQAFRTFFIESPIFPPQ